MSDADGVQLPDQEISDILHLDIREVSSWNAGRYCNCCEASVTRLVGEYSDIEIRPAPRRILSETEPACKLHDLKALRFKLGTVLQILNVSLGVFRKVW